jgi:membrane-bound lytic murein transglycosylase D
MSRNAELTPRITSFYILASPRPVRGARLGTIEDPAVNNERVRDRATPRQRGARALALVGGLALAACAPGGRMHGPDSRPQAPAAPGIEDPAPRGEWPSRELPAPTEEAAATEPPVELPADEPALAEGEAVSESPLDRLADIEPELEPRELVAELDRVVDDAPLFDIPMEVNDRVLAWVDVYSGRMRESFEGGLARSGRYLDMFRRIFDEAGLPQDLVYMAHVESAYKTSAYSRAHARGIFQFVAATARRYGLRVDDWVDERADPEKSARAAAAYMRDLYAEFGDWYLALAAYNAGEGKIRHALAQGCERDFWSMAETRYLRRETKNHVPAILAATLLSKEPEKYGLSYEPEPPLHYDTITVDGAADLQVIARCGGLDLNTLKELNPALRRLQTPPGGSTDVRLPVGTGSSTMAALGRVPVSERVLYVRHRVRQGDTLSQIAGRYGTSIRTIQDTNGLGRKTLIRVGQVLRIPTAAATRFPEADVAELDGRTDAPVTHHVLRGDTLYAIARRYGTTPEAIAAQNGIAVHSVLLVGTRLKVSGGGSHAANGAAAPRGAPPARNERVVHTVRRGETLSRIAALYDTTVRTLCAINKITPGTTIYPGTRLTVGFK